MARPAAETRSVSVIIPTKNRPQDLRRAVDSLLGQIAPPQQLIIIDQSPSEDSRREVEMSYRASSKPTSERVKLVYLLDQKISGLTAARNKGMDLATGDVWLFLDDDVVLESDYLEELLAVYDGYANAVGVSGVVTNYERPPLAFRLWTQAFVRGPFHDDRQSVYWDADSLSQSEPLRVTRLGGGLMSFRANAIGGLRFDDNLRGVCDGEDVEFCARIGPDSLLMIAPRARLVHNLSPSGRDKSHWLRRHARAQYYLYLKNWNRGLQNRIWFYWLNTGYALVAMWASVRKLSIKPWQALLTGIRESKEPFQIRTRNNEKSSVLPAP
jgi:GT2 family glycosyltransferase